MSLSPKDISLIKTLFAEQDRKIGKSLKCSEVNLRQEMKELQNETRAEIQTLKIYTDTNLKLLHNELNQKFDKLNKTIDKLAYDFIEITGGILANHETRISKLEQKRAL